MATRRRLPAGRHKYPRSARLSETLREVLAEELVRIDDERLEFVTITSIDVDNELNRAVVFFDSLSGESGDEAIIEVLEQHRRRMQSSINRQIRAKKTPVLDFRPDDVIRAAERIDEILRSDREPRTLGATVAKRRPPTIHGVAVVDKPAGVTSHDVVGQLRHRFEERRIGHAGTLDPGATGVLVVGVGMVTRLLRFITDGRKRYTGEVVVGIETDSLDADGVVTVTHERSRVDLGAAHSVIAEHLLGDIEQVPPMVSAVQVSGRRLHDLARQGVEVERAPRQVRVDRFDIVGELSDADGRQVLQVEVDCGSGTYVRSLAADLGHLLGTGAHLRNLRRIAVEPFTIEEAAPPATCALLPPIEAVRALSKVDGRRGDATGDCGREAASGSARRRTVGDGHRGRSAAGRVRTVGRRLGEAGGRPPDCDRRADLTGCL